MFSFFFQAEDGIRDAQESRGLGDVYKRQRMYIPTKKARSFSGRVDLGSLFAILSYLFCIHFLIRSIASSILSEAVPNEIRT